MTKTDKLYFDMLRIRMIEEAIARKYPEGKMRCPVHLSVGQEAGAVGICAGLGPDDKMVSTHRSHAHYLAKGGSLVGLLGELYGKAIGCSRGNGGSMHLIDLSCNFYGSTSIVGGTIPVGVGLAWADRLKGSNAYTVVCVGDAAVEEGVFHEAANFASLHQLNVIFFCENNYYSCYTPLTGRQPRHNFEALAKFHQLTYFQYGENDVKALGRLESKHCEGPCFVEFHTFRHLQHCGPENDDHLEYRNESLVHYWRNLDPVRITDNGWPILINKEIEEAFAEAEAAPFPDPSEAGKYVYADHV